MMANDPMELLEQVQDGVLDPIAAADELFRMKMPLLGFFPTGGKSADPAGTLRIQALMGRLLWHSLKQAGGVDLPTPDGLEGYRDFLQASMRSDDSEPDTLPSSET
jgi:hypothetical protein